MKDLLVILWHYLGQYAKTRLAYKADFLIASFTSILATIAGYGFVLVLFTRIPHLQGWKFEEILFIYGFSLIPMGLFNIISLNLYEFGDAYIVEGKFDRVLLRPLHSLFQVLFENFRLESLQEIIIGMAAVGYCSVKLGIPGPDQPDRVSSSGLLRSGHLYIYICDTQQREFLVRGQD